MKPLQRELSPLERAAEWLRGAERPVCIVGRGALRSKATDSLLALCTRIPRLQVASTPGAKGVFPEDHRQAVGVFGFSGHAAAERAVSEADVVLVVGTRLYEQSSNNWHARLSGPRVIRVDVDAARALGSSSLVGDADAILSGLAALLNTGRAPNAASKTNLVRAIPRFEGEASGARDRMVLPQALFGVLSRIASDVPITADAGHALCFCIEWLERIGPNSLQLSLDWGSMGFALPAAIGVSLARGGKPAICVVGDGAMLMAGGDLHTAVELELPLVVIVLNNAGAGMVESGSAALYGPGRVPDASYRYRVNFSAYARALGANGEVVCDCEQFAERLALALRRETPSVLDVQIDPSEVPRAIRERARSMWQRGES
jgi:acetolactate synthase-1/2/3 large subunit